MSSKGEKVRARAGLHDARAAIPPSERVERAARIAERLVRVLEGRETVMVFLSAGAEVPTDEICERLVAEGHRLAVPHVGDGELVPVEFVPGEPLAGGPLSIREPADLRALEPRAMDAVVTPGVGFDRGGVRLGRGGGYYDRFLRRCRPDVLRVGVGFCEQIVPHVPHGENDEAVDVVVTDRETVFCR